MKREVLFIFLMVVGLLTGCQAAGSTSPELPTPPENLYSTEDSQILLAFCREELIPYLKYVEG